MDETIKSLTITGDAATSMNKSRRPVGSRKKRNQKEDDEEFIEQAKQYSLEKSKAPETPAVVLKPATVLKPSFLKAEVNRPEVNRPEVKVQSPQTLIVKTETPRAYVPPVNNHPPVDYDGSSKVILKPSKFPRVKLQPKAHSKVAPQVVQTRKARKIRLTVGNLKHRFTRAKRVKDETEEKSMETIKSYLVHKGVIQEKSKAPDRMLRSMYRDFMLLKDTAL
jgi:hypothetical protein